jgi:hypothetical protein
MGDISEGVADTLEPAKKIYTKKKKNFVIFEEQGNRIFKIRSVCLSVAIRGKNFYMKINGLKLYGVNYKHGKSQEHK